MTPSQRCHKALQYHLVSDCLPSCLNLSLTFVLSRSPFCGCIQLVGRPSFHGVYMCASPVSCAFVFIFLVASASDFLRSWAFDCKVPRGLRQALRAANVVDKLQYWKEAYLQCVADTSSTLSAGPLSGCLVHIHKSVSKEETKMLLQIVSELGGCESFIFCSPRTTGVFV